MSCQYCDEFAANGIGKELLNGKARLINKDQNRWYCDSNNKSYDYGDDGVPFCIETKDESGNWGQPVDIYYCPWCGDALDHAW